MARQAGGKTALAVSAAVAFVAFVAVSGGRASPDWTVECITLAACYCAVRSSVRDGPPGQALEWTSLLHSVLAVAFSLIGVTAAALAGGEPAGRWQTFVRLHSYSYFVFDLVCNCAGLFAGGFSRAYALHHTTALVLLWLSLAYQLDWICWSIIITEWTNPARAFEAIYLMNNNYSPAAKADPLRLRFKHFFAVTFVASRAVVLPVFAVYWLARVEPKLPPIAWRINLVAALVLLLGGFYWSAVIVRKYAGK